MPQPMAFKDAIFWILGLVLEKLVFGKLDMKV